MNNFSYVAVGNEFDILVILQPEIVVLHYHQHITPGNLFFSEKYRTPYAFVEKVCPFV